ncbi:hypothetical protein JCM10212_004218 [Sporobolomyces blumeae]
MRHSAWNSPATATRQVPSGSSSSSSSFPTSSSSISSPWGAPAIPAHHDAAAGASHSGPERVQSVLDRVLAQLDGFEDDMDCPLCLEEMDLSDLNFKPCPCGYQICRFCYHHIKENLNNRCPACRTPYDDASVEFKAIKPDEMKRLQAAKKLRDKRRKDEAQRIQIKSDVRVRQRTQVHVQGMTTKIANEDTLQQLKGPEHFGQYGKILKLFMSKRSANVTQPASPHPHFQPVNVYINYRTAAEASNCIAAVDGTITDDGHKLKAIWGTTRYCPNYLKGIRCHNDTCTLAHEQGEEIEGPAPVGKDEIFTYDNETTSRVKTTLPSAIRKQPEASLPATASWASKDAPRPPSTPIILNPHLPPLSATLPKPVVHRTISIGKPKNHPLPARPSSRAQREAAAASATANAAASTSSAAAGSSPSQSPALAAPTAPSRSVSISLKTTSKSSASKTPTPSPPSEPADAPEPPSPVLAPDSPEPSPSPPPSDPTPPPEPAFVAEPESEQAFAPPSEYPTLPSFPDLTFGEGAFSFSLNLDVKGKGRAFESEEAASPLRDFGNLEGFGRSSSLDASRSDEAEVFSPGGASTTSASSYVGSFDPFAADSTFGGGSLDLRSPSPSPPSTAGAEDISRRSSRFGFARRGSSTVGKNAGDLVSALARSAFSGGREPSPGGLPGGVPFAPPGIGLPPRSSAASAAFVGLPPLGTASENLWPASSGPSFPPGVLRSIASPHASNASSPQLSPHSRNGVLPSQHPGQQQQQHQQPQQHHFGPPPGITGPPPSAANSALPPPPGIALNRAPIPAASFPLPPPAPRPTNSNSSNVAKEDLLALIAAAQASASKQQPSENAPPPHPFFSDPAILNARLAGPHQPPPQQSQGAGILGALGGGGSGVSQLDALFNHAAQAQAQQAQQQSSPFPPGMRPFGLPPHQQQQQQQQQQPQQHHQGPPGMYRPGPPGLGKA